MTEKQAIERIAIEMMWRAPGLDLKPESHRILAQIAWNEMKAVALEQGTLPAGWHPAIDGRNKPEAWAEYTRAQKRVGMS